MTTELIVGSAPPERAGAASGISETGAELGGALGLAILGSIGSAIYRSTVAEGLPVGLSQRAAAVTRDTLGGAVAIAAELPDGLGPRVLEVARDAFVEGMQTAAAISAVIAVIGAVLVAVTLRNIRPGLRERAAIPDPDVNGMVLPAIDNLVPITAETPET